MMKLKSKLFTWIESFSYVEMSLIFLFLLFIIVPISFNRTFALFFDSSLGMVLLFLATLYFFLVTHPVLGVLFLFVSYELLRRSHAVVKHVPILRSEGMEFHEPRQTTPVINHEPLIKEGDQPVISQSQRDSRMASMNPHTVSSLEEEIVALYGPTRINAIYEPSTFDPITSSKIQASVFT